MQGSKTLTVNGRIHSSHLDANQNHDPNILVLFGLICLPHSFPTFFQFGIPLITIVPSSPSFPPFVRPLPHHVLCLSVIGGFVTMFRLRFLLLVFVGSHKVSGLENQILDGLWDRISMCVVHCVEKHNMIKTVQCLFIFFLIFICGVSNRLKKKSKRNMILKVMIKIATTD